MRRGQRLSVQPVTRAGVRDGAQAVEGPRAVKGAGSKAAQCGAMAAAPHPCRCSRSSARSTGLARPAASLSAGGLNLSILATITILALRARSPASAAAEERLSQSVRGPARAPCSRCSRRPSRPRRARFARCPGDSGRRLRAGCSRSRRWRWRRWRPGSLACTCARRWCGRIFWALAAGILLAVLSTMERPDALDSRAERSAAPRARLRRPTFVLQGRRRVAQGKSSQRQLFFLLPTYAPTSSAVEPLHALRRLAALLACLLVGLLVASRFGHQVWARAAPASRRPSSRRRLLGVHRGANRRDPAGFPRPSDEMRDVVARRSHLALRPSRRRTSRLKPKRILLLVADLPLVHSYQVTNLRETACRDPQSPAPGR